MTIRERIRACAVEIRTGDLPPARARELLAVLSSLIGNCNDEIREADMAYASVLIGFLDGEEAANRARIRAQTSPEYQRAREAKDTKELLVELIRSLKRILQSIDEEMRLAR